jgi:hypothetical protein
VNFLRDTLEKTAHASLLAGELVPHLPYDGVIPLAAALAVAPVAFAGFLATDTGRLLLRELRRRQRLREKRPASPSLRGTPTATELDADGALVPRTLTIRLRLGSRLADLEPTIDNTLRYTTLPTGAKRIRSRAPGLKGYLADHRVAVPYATLMRYKKLAVRLRQLLALDPRLPLEWLLPGAAPDRPLPPDLLAPFDTARRRLSKLLRTHRTFQALSLYVDTKLGIPQLLSVRRATRRREAAARARRVDARGRALHAHSRSVVLYGRTVTLVPSRVDATKRALVQFLRDRDLSSPLLHLRNKTLHWLSSVAER